MTSVAADRSGQFFNRVAPLARIYLAAVLGVKLVSSATVSTLRQVTGADQRFWRESVLLNLATGRSARRAALGHLEGVRSTRGICLEARRRLSLCSGMATLVSFGAGCPSGGDTECFSGGLRRQTKKAYVELSTVRSTRSPPSERHFDDIQWEIVLTLLAQVSSTQADRYRLCRIFDNPNGVLSGWIRKPRASRKRIFEIVTSGKVTDEDARVLL